MNRNDDAILERIFNPEVQGLPLDSVSQTVEDNPVKVIEPELLNKLKSMERQAVDLAEKDDLEGALEILNQCLALEKDYASAYNNRAQIYRLRKDDDKALEDLSKVIELGQGQPKVLRQAYTQRAIIKRQHGDMQGSRADFEMGAKLGNPIARNIAVNENPYAKMCNQVMMEMMGREMKGTSDHVEK
ncbi:uncharacterized protein BX664DRAFT_329782 [Halteromyces radiatus]|uniref:uncharacterized protein n=1 Tax=Halteromyces radiatus TaxID=101107 RepID=UPI0022200466|nr:uncharacterized protein BX664DRAFT_329782 [Halteromyces radiatus]KAI8093468.1 hypothetical protein BX664DRAFT_329782 [Halteromyces radiatus]